MNMLIAAAVMVILVGGIAAVMLIVFPEEDDAIESLSLPAPEEVPVKENAVRERKVLEGNRVTGASSFEITASVTYPVRILGKAGFDPDDMIIVEGDSITWSNDDPREEIIVLTFQSTQDRFRFITSPALKGGESWEYVFNEVGSYSYWSTAYGTKGKVEILPCRVRGC